LNKGRPNCPFRR